MYKILIYQLAIFILFLNFIFSCKDKTNESTENVENNIDISTDYTIPLITKYPASNEDIGFVNQVKGLILRSEASQESMKITILPLFSIVFIIDENGPSQKINGYQGKWYKVLSGNKTGWVFGPMLSVIKNSTSNRKKPDFNNMKLSYKTNNICCGCGGADLAKTIILKNGLVSYKEKYEDESGQEETVSEGKYEIRGDTIVIYLNEGTKTTNSPQSSEKVPGRIFSLEWDDEVKGFIGNDEKKYKTKGKYFVNMVNCQFVSVRGFVAYDLCLKGKGDYFNQFKTNNDEEDYLGFYCENNR